MPLKTLVKVGSITNLSDARYCAGMGVDMLGFRAVEGAKDHIDHKLYQQIRGWVSGPKFIAECYGLNESTPVQDIISNFAPDYIEVSFNEYLNTRHKFKIPFIVNVRDTDSIPAGETFQDVAYWLTTSSSPSTVIVDSQKPILFDAAENQNIDDALMSPFFSGISLAGSPEVRPGFKDYGNLSEILEKLEQEN